MLLDLVDALSAPIQFMSQAEKRAKQMQEMGIDASDISDHFCDVRATPPSAAASTTAAAAVKHTHTTAAKPAPPPQNGRTNAPLPERSNSNTPSLHNAVNLDKKKGKDLALQQILCQCQCQ